MKRAERKQIVAEDLRSLIDDADAVFSQYIRLKNADKNGFVKCFTCENIKHWTLMQCGHFKGRAHLLLRFDERNCKPQDQDCNEHKRGNLKVYRERLEIQSPGLPEILDEEAALVHKPTRDEIRMVISEYTPKVKALKLKLTGGTPP